MKHVIAIIIILACTFSTFSQNTICGTDYFLEKEYKKDPSFQNVVAQNWMVSDGPSTHQSGSRSVKIIPVVFHIFHDNGVGDISYDQILSAMEMLNEDFRRTNLDASSTRAIFAPFAADSEVEFRLAQVDPDGNCTDGVERINDAYHANNADNGVKPISYWPSNQYFNVWVVNTIESSNANGIILGYAQFPGSGSWNTYGVVVRNDRVGRVGTATSGDRTLTHEVGHCLNLLHTFQSGCGNRCENSGDRVCDTPPSAYSTQTCNTFQNLCSNDASGNSVYNTDVVDQIENYMSYNDCQNMFSLGQKDRMQNSLRDFSTLSNLTSATNLAATGVINETPGLCKAEFDVDQQVVCIGQSVNFTDHSFFHPRTHNWSFEGASPATSTEINPSVSYHKPGVYEVTLTVTDDFNHSVTTTKTNFVTVLSSYGKTMPIAEFFDTDKTMSELQWFGDAFSTGMEWKKSTHSATVGTGSIKASSYGLAGVINLTSPSYDIGNAESATLGFKHAYAPRTGETTNLLRIYASGDCGETWSLLRVLGGAILATRGSMSAAYTFPAANDWKWNQYALPASVLTENLRIRFEFNVKDGNNLFIDEINIYGNLAEDIILKAPQNGAVNRSVNQLLNWNATATVDYYEVEMDTDTSFNSSNYVNESLAFISSASNASDTEWEVTDLAHGQTYYWRVRTNLNGVDTAFSETWSFTVDSSVVGIKPITDAALGMRIFPNPAHELVNVEMNVNSIENVRIHMYDVTGNLVRIIHEGTLNSGTTNFQVNRDGLPHGIYLIRSVSGSGSTTERVIFD